MRGRDQLEQLPGDYRSAQGWARKRILRDLSAELKRAREQNAPWYQWIVWRRDRVHKHGLRNERSELIACPVPGCHWTPDDKPLPAPRFG